MAVLLLVLGFVGIAEAASLSISPATITKAAGDVFDASIMVNGSGSKVCVVEGILALSNLSCQSITVADGLMAQTAPTCTSPKFIIGIPGCATTEKTLFTASVKAGSAGVTSLSFTGVDIIGEGMSLGSASVGGTYTVVAAATPVVTPVTTTTTTKAPVTSTTKVTTTVPKTNVATTANKVVASDDQTSAVSEAVSTTTQTEGEKTSTWAIIMVALIAIIGVGYLVFKNLRKV